MFPVLALFTLLLQSADPTLEELIRDARSGQAEVRRKARTALATRGTAGCDALRPMISDQLGRLDAQVQTLLKGPLRTQNPIVRQLRALAVLELPGRREAALAFIRDERRFTRDPASGAEMQRLVDAVVDVVQRPAQTFRRKVKELDALATELEELLSFVPLLDLEPPKGLSCAKELLARFGVAAAVSDLANPRPQTDRNHKVLDWLPAPPLSATIEESKVMELTNRHRLLLGLPALEFDERLVRSTRSHSREMCERAFFGHESAKEGRKTPTDRAHLYGYSGDCAENIASQGTADSAFQAWLLAPAQHRNLLGADHEQIGVGFWSGNGRTNFTMDLGGGDRARTRKVTEPSLAWLAARSATKDDDVMGWRRLLRMAQASKLPDETAEAARRLLKLAPDDLEAQRALGK